MSHEKGREEAGVGTSEETTFLESLRARQPDPATQGTGGPEGEGQPGPRGWAAQESCSPAPLPLVWASLLKDRLPQGGGEGAFPQPSLSPRLPGPPTCVLSEDWAAAPPRDTWGVGGKSGCGGESSPAGAGLRPVLAAQGRPQSTRPRTGAPLAWWGGKWALGDICPNRGAPAPGSRHVCPPHILPHRPTSHLLSRSAPCRVLYSTQWVSPQVSMGHLLLCAGH